MIPIITSVVRRDATVDRTCYLLLISEVSTDTGITKTRWFTYRSIGEARKARELIIELSNRNSMAVEPMGPVLTQPPVILMCSEIDALEEGAKK